MLHAMRMALLSLMALLCACGSAMAQGSPNLMPNQVPTAAQWNKFFANKWDYPGYTALNKGGDVMLGLLRFNMGVPTVTSCGTSPSIRGNNQVFEVTFGTGSPTGCTVTFNGANPYSAKPVCDLHWTNANLAAMTYTYTNAAITLTQTAHDSSVVVGQCWGVQ